MNEKLNQIIEKIKEKTKKKCYSFTLADENPALTDSKLGGIPYMKVDETYPLDSKGNAMPLFIQINFQDIDLENYPKAGLLQIFVDKDLSYPTEYKVKYVEKTSDDFTQNDPRNYGQEQSNLTECIVKVDSNLDMDRIYIGDAGIAWLLISEADLKAKRFENAKFDWDCC